MSEGGATSGPKEHVGMYWTNEIEEKIVLRDGLTSKPAAVQHS